MKNSFIDLIIRIKNGYMSHKKIIISPYSKFRVEILKKLKNLGFIKDFKFRGEKIQIIDIELLYQDEKPAMMDVEIFSRPGQRQYVSYKDLKPVLNGFGYSILSTPKGVLTNIEARQQKIGGELLFSLW